MTEFKFQLYEKGNYDAHIANIFIDIDNGFIELHIDVKNGITDLFEGTLGVPTGTSLAKGEDVFNAIYDRLITEEGIESIEGIRARWVAQDNLDTFNKLILEEVIPQKITIEEAALKTFTGKMAERKGYSKVSHIGGVKNSDGTYKMATVEFIKPK